jgi:hypothetical protein
MIAPARPRLNAVEDNGADLGIDEKAQPWAKRLCDASATLQTEVEMPNEEPSL